MTSAVRVNGSRFHPGAELGNPSRNGGPAPHAVDGKIKIKSQEQEREGRDGGPASNGSADGLAPTAGQTVQPRILVIDDMPAIHEDFRKILVPANGHDPAVAELEAAFPGPRAEGRLRTCFTVDCAFRGEVGLELLSQSLAQGNPYRLAFVDVRMPSGWDGIETSARLRKADPAIQIVICTAHADYSWEQITEKLGQSDGLLILKKPFDTLEVLQLAETLNQKWLLEKQARLRLADLDRMVDQHTLQLQQANEKLAAEIAERSRTQIRLSVFSTLAYRLSAARNAKEAGRIIVDTADQLLGWDACLVDLYSPESDKLTHVIHEDLIDGKRTETPPNYLRRCPSPLARKTLQEGGQLILHEPPYDQEPEAHRFGNIARSSASLMYVPVRNGTAVTGVLSIQSYTPKAYDQHSLETLQTLADHCGGAMDRIRNEEALRNAQEQLRQSQKLEALGQLAGGVAHDFNNLLAVIRGNADLARMLGKALNREVLECLNQISGASERAANLTRQLLAFSRKQMMQSQPANLNGIVLNFTKMLQRIIGEQIDLQCHFAAGLPPVQADIGMIEQVLVNLVVNARDAMAEGGRLQITTDQIRFQPGEDLSHPEARAGHFVCLAVQDTGAGIAAEHLPHIFEPFFTTKPVGKGTGLGLATVYGIVKQHQGWIEVSSQAGIGSTFKIFFPALQNSSPAIDRRLPEFPPCGGKETILLVEDEEAVRSVMRSLLQRSGYQVLEAGCGPEAFTLWQESARVDLLLTDVILPDGMSGRKLAEELRARDPALKVVFVTGYSGEVMGPETEPLGRKNSYLLQKPCPPRELLGAVRRCLDGLPPVESDARVAG